jgi:hypothetical protein
LKKKNKNLLTLLLFIYKFFKWQGKTSIERRYSAKEVFWHSIAIRYCIINVKRNVKPTSISIDRHSSTVVGGKNVLLLAANAAHYWWRCYCPLHWTPSP